MSTQHSTVKWFDAKKGYGFIDHPDGGDDVFVHYSQIESEKDFKTLRTGQPVEFELSDGPKGLHAVSVIPADEAQQEKEEVILAEAAGPGVASPEIKAEPAPAASAEAPAPSGAPPSAGNGQVL